MIVIISGDLMSGEEEKFKWVAVKIPENEKAKWKIEDPGLNLYSYFFEEVLKQLNDQYVQDERQGLLIKGKWYIYNQLGRHGPYDTEDDAMSRHRQRPLQCVLSGFHLDDFLSLGLSMGPMPDDV